MNVSRIMMIINYIFSMYGVFCFINRLHNTNGLQSFINPYKRPSSLEVRALNQDYMNAIRENVAHGNYGNEWTFQELQENIRNSNIEFASLMNDDQVLVAAEKSSLYDKHTVDGLHYVRVSSSLIRYIIDVLIQNKVQFIIDNYTAQPPALVIIFLKIIGTTTLYVSVLAFYYIVRTFLLKYMNSSTRKSYVNNIRGFLTGQPGNKVVINDNEKSNTNFTHVAGCDEAKFELQEVVDFLKTPTRYNEAGAVVPRGVLLEGPPGTGKTLLARATAGEAGVNFISKSASEFVEVFVGVGASRMRELFEEAGRKSPCIIFIDEIDAIGRKRDSFGSNDERDQTLNQLLTNMDGFDKTENIIVIASTNRADILDKALLRPGRFDRKVRVGLPDRDGRKDILDVHLKGKRVGSDVDLDAIYDLTTGFSGADLANLANEAAIMSVRNNVTRIDMKSFNDAYEKTTIGLPKAKDLRDEESREMVAYHESGHAIVAKSFYEFVDVRKVTINANNNGAGGYTLFTPKEKYVSFPSRKYMFASMVIAMAGRAAEMMFFNKQHNEPPQPRTRQRRKPQNNTYNYVKERDSKNNEQMNQEFMEAQMDVFISNLDNEVEGSSQVTLGSSSDVRRATEIARQYISVFGTSDALGAGLEWNEQSERVKGEIDVRIARLVKSAQDMAVSILERRDIDLQKLSSLLLEKGTVSGNEVP